MLLNTREAITLKLALPDYKYNNLTFSNIEKFILLFVAFSVLIGVSFYNFNVFQYIVNHVSLVLSFYIFAIIINTCKLLPNSHYNFLGISFGFMSIFEFIRSFYSLNFNVTLQLNICSSFFLCLIVIFSIINIKENVKPKILFYAYSVVSTIFISSIFWWHSFPGCFYTGTGLSLFFRIITFFTIAIFLTGLFFIFKNYKRQNNPALKLVAAYIIILVIYYHVILFYNGSSSYSLIVADFVRLLSYIPICVLVTRITFISPMEFIFTKINSKNEELTKKEDLLEKKNLELIWKNKALVKANSLILSSEQKYKKLIEFLPDAILLLKDTEIVLSNRELIKMFKGFIPDNVAGKNIMQYIPNNFKWQLKSHLDYVYEGNNIRSAESTLDFGNGTAIHVEYSILYSMFDNEKHALVIFNDVTEKRQLQKILNDAKLEEANEKMKMEFLANVSHELRTPVNLIYSALQLEDVYLGGGNVDSVKRYNKVIKQNCYRLLRIVNNIIDATKIDACFFKPNMRFMNIVALVEEATLSVVPYVESKNMDIIFDTDIEEQYLMCDPDLIERIILNLLSNAVKYGVYEGVISVTMKDCQDCISISIKDNGIGIPESKKDSLFQRFTQVDKSFTRNAEGSGIGLYLVKQFVDMHNGSIEVNSSDGSGSEFIIKFPYCENAKEYSIEIRELDKDTLKHSNIIDKVNIEFADIYMD